MTAHATSKGGAAPGGRAPLAARSPVLFWAWRNLFSSPLNVVLTLVCGWLTWAVVSSLVDWAILRAVIDAGSRDECRALMDDRAAARGREPGHFGACWAVIATNVTDLVYGFYPREHWWRPNLAFALMLPALAGVLWERAPGRGWWLLFACFYPFVAAWLLVGGDLFLAVVLALAAAGLAAAGLAPALREGGLTRRSAAPLAVAAVALVLSGILFSGAGLERVDTRSFGGFLLTLVIGITGIALSLPLGLLLALARRSSMPVLRLFAVVFIEFIRGVPLITLLFIASILMAYFLPPDATVDLLLRVLIMVTLFASAYMAEVVRGGFQALPRGQYEAAEALGLSYWQGMRKVVMPQVLKITIPGIVNSFIALYKDTTLVIIIGLFDPIGTGRVLLSDAQWAGLAAEMYFFCAVFFFVSCFLMSRYSLWLERRLSHGHERLGGKVRARPGGGTRRWPTKTRAGARPPRPRPARAPRARAATARAPGAPGSR